MNNAIYKIFEDDVKAYVWANKVMSLPEVNHEANKLVENDVTDTTEKARGLILKYSIKTLTKIIKDGYRDNINDDKLTHIVKYASNEASETLELMLHNQAKAIELDQNLDEYDFDDYLEDVSVMGESSDRLLSAIVKSKRGSNNEKL